MSEIKITPVITEKAARKVQEGCYVFKVSRDANKHQISQMVNALYKVKVQKVNIINKKEEAVLARGRFAGYKKAWKKAMVTLVKGAKIAEFEQDKK